MKPVQCGMDGEAVRKETGEGGWCTAVAKYLRVCVRVCVRASRSHLLLLPLSLSLSQQGVCVGGGVKCLDLKGKLNASLPHY